MSSFFASARFVLPFVSMLAGAFFAATGGIHAAPMTLQFEAIVGPSRHGFDGMLPPNWNISLQEGDTISGAFTFEPFDAASNAYTTTLVQPFDFTVQIKTRSLAASQYGISVHNDIPLIDESPLLTDTISVGSAYFVVDTTPGNPGPPIEWSFLIGLIGESSILDGADIPQGPASWEQFMHQRSLIVSFPQDVSGAYGFGATLTSFSLVPEPTAAFVIMTAVVSLVIVFRIDRRCAVLHWEAMNVTFSRTQSRLLPQD